MAQRFISRGFAGRRRQPDTTDRVPPGQHLVSDFPVLSAGPTPRVPLDQRSEPHGGDVARRLRPSTC